MRIISCKDHYYKHFKIMPVNKIYTDSALFYQQSFTCCYEWYPLASKVWFHTLKGKPFRAWWFSFDIDVSKIWRL